MDRLMVRDIMRNIIEPFDNNNLPDIWIFMHNNALSLYPKLFEIGYRILKFSFSQRKERI